MVSHCGNTLPSVVERMSAFGTVSHSIQVSSVTVKQIFKTRFCFDLAGITFPGLIRGYLQMSSADRLPYGSDYPYTPGSMVEGFVIQWRRIYFICSTRLQRSQLIPEMPSGYRKLLARIQDLSYLQERDGSL